MLRMSKWLNTGGYLLIGNLKNINPCGGFFRSHIGAKEINDIFKIYCDFSVGKISVGGDDILLLLRKHLNLRQ